LKNELEEVVDVIEESTAVDEFLFAVTGVGEREFFSLARQEPDPWNFVQEVLAELTVLDEDWVPCDCETWCECERPWCLIVDTEEQLDFERKCRDFLDNLDVALTAREARRDDELWLEPKFDFKYSLRNFRDDVVGRAPTQWATEEKAMADARWKNSSESKHIRLLTEWGNFDFGVTDRASRATLRVRTQTRKGVPHLGVGAVWVNMNTGSVKCWVNGCKFARRLRYNPDGTDEFDREYAEFQVLSILQHLGDHTLVNPANYWTPIVHVKRFRDDREVGPMELFVGRYDACELLDSELTRQVRVNGFA
jgi:hypothetical protein